MFVLIWTPRLNIHCVTYSSGRYGNAEHAMSGDEEERRRRKRAEEINTPSAADLNGLHDNYLHYTSHL